MRTRWPAWLSWLAMIEPAIPPPTMTASYTTLAAASGVVRVVAPYGKITGLVSTSAVTGLLLLLVPAGLHPASSAVMCSAVRRVSAAMGRVGFEVPIVGKLPE